LYGARASGVVADGSAIAQLTFFTSDNSSTKNHWGINTLSGEDGGYGHVAWTFATATYEAEEWYVLTSNAGYPSDFDHFTFSGIANNVDFTTVQTSSLTNVTEVTSRKAVNTMMNTILGIGTTNPDSLLEISGSGNQQLKVTRTDESVETVVLSQPNEGWIGTQSNHALKIGTNYNAKMYLSTGGDLGINENNPSYRLDVNADSTNVVARFKSTDGIAAIKLEDNNGNVELSASGNTFRVQPNGGSAVVVITGGGEVGIGETNPTGQLETTGNVQFNTGGTSLPSSGYGAVQIGQTNNSDQDGLAVWSSGRGRTLRLWTNETDSYIYSGGGGSAPLYLNGSSGTTYVDGKLYVGGRFRLPFYANDPTSSPQAGEMYYNTSDKIIKYYDGSRWAVPSSNTLRISTFDIFGDGSTVALWQMDGNSNDTGGQYNLSGSNNFVTGIFGSAFNGTGSTYLESSNSGLNISGSYSVSFWYNSSTAGQSNKRLVTVKGSDTSSGWNNYNGSLGFYTGEGETLGGTPGVTRVAEIPDNLVNDGQWHHLVYTVTTGGHSATWKIYLDGVEYNNPVSGEGRSFNNGSFVAVTTYDGGTGYNTIGKVDQLRIINRVITSVEVAQLYNAV